MFLPARMTRILVGGHQEHMAAAIETLHQEGAVHIEDYSDPTGTTRIGTPLEHGDRVSELLVRLRGLQKALGAEGVRGKAMVTNDPAALLDEAETACSGALERAAGLRAQIAALEAEQSALAPYRDLGVDLALVTGWRSMRAYVGTSRSDPRPLLQGIPHEGDVAPQGAGFAVALFVPTAQAVAAERILSESGFQAAQLPAARGTPAQRLAELASRRAPLQAALGAAAHEAAHLREAWGPRLAALERHLSSEVEKTQAPLHFGVTATTFHLEGWVPRSKVARVQNALAARFADRVYTADLGDAPKGLDAPAHHHEVGEHAQGHAHGHEGGHHADDPADEPPIHLENKGAAKPYEFMLGLLGRPRYSEIDPTKLMLVFFPLFFGLMVGDLLVGLIIVLVGLLLKKHKVFGIGGPAVGRALVMGGAMAAVVGLVVFGEGLGIHFVTPEPHEEGEEKEISWEEILGITFPSEGFLHKTGGEAHAAGLDGTAHLGGALGGEGHAGETEGTGTGYATETAGPATDGTAEGAPGSTASASETASGTLTPHAEEAEVEESGGILTPHSDVHLSVNGWFNLGYYSKIHDIQALLVWSLLIGFVHLVLGLVLGVRNVYVRHGAKLAIQEKVAWLTLILGVLVLVWGLMGGSRLGVAAGTGVAVVSVGLLWAGAAHTLGVGFIAILEVPSLAGNLLSYTRLAAIGASKAGMALAFAAIGFDTLGGGDVHSPIGWFVYLLGFLLLIVLSILAGSLQSLRLQFVEFFSKFYVGGGRPYVPFGRRAP